LSTEYTTTIKGEYVIRRYQYRFYFRIETTNGKIFIVEIDGPQHKIQVWNWGVKRKILYGFSLPEKLLKLQSPLLQQIRDKYKENKARSKKLKVLRLDQEDVLFDKTDWKTQVTDFVSLLLL
jgi:hypothetical protein